MYKIKTNGKYILLIKDLGITLSHESLDGALVTDENFENSIDIKKLLRYLTVEKLDENGKSNSVIDEIKVKEETNSFVAHEKATFQPEGVFVRDVNDFENIPSAVINETKIIPAVEVLEIPSDTKIEEVKVETAIETKEVVTEEKSSNEVKAPVEVKKTNNKKQTTKVTK